MTIKLQNELTSIPAGSRLRVTLGARSTVQNVGNLVYLIPVPDGSRATVGKVDADAAGAAETRVTVIAHIAAAALALSAPAATPGVTANEITLGATIPISGPAAAYGSVGRGADAYFKYVNSKGGVFGRKIVYKYLDDEFDVSKTITLTRQLVEQDQVFAIFNSVGTEHALAIRSYLNDRKVPQLFLGSGVSKLATEHAKYPWSMGYLPSFAGEGAVYGRYIAAHQPKARIGVLYENSDFGKDMLNGLRRGLKGKAKIVGAQSYEITDSDVPSQIAQAEERRREHAHALRHAEVRDLRLRRTRSASAGTRRCTSRRSRSRRTS